MLIGFVYDLRRDYLSRGFSEEEAAEFDSEETIGHIESAIKASGYRVERIGNACRLCERLVAGDRWDMVFNIAEGMGGRCRESQVPAILELYSVPYTFSDALVCAATLDKAFAKRLVMHAGLATPEFAVIRTDRDVSNVKPVYPLFAKPLAEGTGKGIDEKSVISDARQLKNVCSGLLNKYSQPVLVEEFLPGREFTVGILGSGDDARVLGVMEIKASAGSDPVVYSFFNKEECATRITYQPLSGEIVLKAGIEKLALQCYRLLECRDAGRVDIRCDGNGRPCFMEINPLPGLHPTHSDLPMIAAQEGMSYVALIGAILSSALERNGNTCSS